MLRTCVAGVPPGGGPCGSEDHDGLHFRKAEGGSAFVCGLRARTAISFRSAMSSRLGFRTTRRAEPHTMIAWPCSSRTRGPEAPPAEHPSGGPGGRTFRRLQTEEGRASRPGPLFFKPLFCAPLCISTKITPLARVVASRSPLLSLQRPSYFRCRVTRLLMISSEEVFRRPIIWRGSSQNLLRRGTHAPFRPT